VEFAAVRAFALALPGATEEPHHAFGSFRVGGKIFATFPPDERHLHVFVSEIHREEALALHPAFIEKLHWGGKVAGLRNALAQARAPVVEELLRRALGHKAPKRKPPQNDCA
jgi:hypothetical protein